MSDAATTKLDARIVRTRKALANALTALALEWGYDNLTILAVTKVAGIGYRTFFRHYQSLDDLLAEAVLTLLQEVARRADNAMSARAEWVVLYTVIHNNQDLMRVYIGLPREHPVRQRVMAIEAKILHARYTAQETTDVPLEVSIDQFLLATNNLVAWYLDNINEHTPQQAAIMHEDLVSSALEHLALVERPDWPPKRPRQ